VKIESLKLDGALKLVADPGAKLVVRAGHMTVYNAGYAVQKLGNGTGVGTASVPGAGTEEILMMRGYSLHKARAWSYNALYCTALLI